MLHVPGPSGQRRPPCRQRIGPSPGSVEAKYDLKENIGAGCYGNVYRGIRKMDGKQFIIKSTTSEVDSNVPGYPLPIPIEVAMMTIVRDPPSPLLIKLQEWFLVKVEKLPRGVSVFIQHISCTMRCRRVCLVSYCRFNFVNSNS